MMLPTQCPLARGWYLPELIDSGIINAFRLDDVAYSDAIHRPLTDAVDVVAVVLR